jgi:hypothetical protein
MSIPWRTRRGVGRLAHIPLETQEQAALFEWAYLKQKQIPELALLFAIPGQGVARLKRLQLEGYQKGVPDMFLAVMVDTGPESQCGGLFIELKRTKGGKVSPEQYEWMGKLEAQGYRCVIARGAAEARKEILAYLGEKE